MGRVRKTPGGLRAAVAAALLIGAVSMASGGAKAEPRAAALEQRVLLETIDEFEERLERDPANPVIGSRLVQDHLAAFALDNDMHHLRRADAIASAQAPVALDRGSAYASLSAVRLARHDFAGSYDAARVSVEADSTGLASQGTLFDSAIAVGEYAVAEGALRSLVTRHPSALGTRFREALWLDAHGDPAAARATLSPACGRLAGRAVRLQLRAWCDVILASFAGSEGDRGAAIALHERAQRIRPGYMPAIEGLAELALAEARWDDAHELYRRIESDAHPDIQLRLAEIERALGLDSSAVERERTFVRLTASPEARRLQASEVARFLAREPHTRDEALAVANEDLRHRRSIEAHETLAIVLYHRGDYALALRTLDGTPRFGPRTPEHEELRRRVGEALSVAQ